MELPFAVAVASIVILLGSVFLILLRGRGKPVAENTQRAVTANSIVSQPDEEEANKPRVRILYGTQTGTAERFSKQLGNELRKKYGESTLVELVDLENYKAADKLGKEKLVIFCMATYGDGEPTDNAADFYNWLVKEVEAVDNGDKEPTLQGLSYAVFGLGNKQYEHFNAVGKKVFKSLQTLGAQPIVPRGDGDDDGCIDDEFDKWCGDVYAALDQSDLVGTKADQKASADTSAADVPAYEVQEFSSGTSLVQAFVEGTGKDHHSPYWAKVTAVRELHTSESERSCVHVEIDVQGSGIKYEHGDHVAVFAKNSPVVVQEMAELLGVNLDLVFTLKMPADSKGMTAPFPGPLTLRTALSYFADVLSSPHKESLAALAAFATDKAEADRLRKMASHEGKQDYAEFIAKPHRSLLEVMHAFPSAKPTLGAFFGTIAPRLQPRFYSISSSPKAHPHSIHVTCAVVQDTMPTGRIHEGVCSTWFKQYGQGAAVPVFIRHSSFKLPSDASRPVIMVGPGTGLAPFRGFLQERAGLVASGMGLGPAVFFFGCRNKDHDFIYEEELQSFLKQGALSQLHVAFSRQGTSKDYVQHHLERQASALWPLLSEQQGYLYVCGDAKHMAKDVHRTLVSMVQASKGCTGTQAEAFVKEMQDKGRYMRDVW